MKMKWGETCPRHEQLTTTNCHDALNSLNVLKHIVFQEHRSDTKCERGIVVNGGFGLVLGL